MSQKSSVQGLLSSQSVGSETHGWEIDPSGWVVVSAWASVSSTGGAVSDIISFSATVSAFGAVSVGTATSSVCASILTPVSDGTTTIVSIFAVAVSTVSLDVSAVVSASAPNSTVAIDSAVASSTATVGSTVANSTIADSLAFDSAIGCSAVVGSVVATSASSRVGGVSAQSKGLTTHGGTIIVSVSANVSRASAFGSATSKPLSTSESVFAGVSVSGMSVESVFVATSARSGSGSSSTGRGGLKFVSSSLSPSFESCESASVSPAMSLALLGGV